jgi:hypothetical protein
MPNRLGETILPYACIYDILVASTSLSLPMGHAIASFAALFTPGVFFWKKWMRYFNTWPVHSCDFWDTFLTKHGTLFSSITWGGKERKASPSGVFVLYWVWVFEGLRGVGPSINLLMKPHALIPFYFFRYPRRKLAQFTPVGLSRAKYVLLECSPILFASKSHVQRIDLDE